MKVEVTVPEEYMGDVMGDVELPSWTYRRYGFRHGAQIIRAKVPLSEMFGYSTTLRSSTQGRGVFSMELSHYEEVPNPLQKKLLQKTKALNDI